MQLACRCGPVQLACTRAQQGTSVPCPDTHLGSPVAASSRRFCRCRVQTEGGQVRRAHEQGRPEHGCQGGQSVCRTPVWQLCVCRSEQLNGGQRYGGCRRRAPGCCGQRGACLPTNQPPSPTNQPPCTTHNKSARKHRHGPGCCGLRRGRPPPPSTQMPPKMDTVRQPTIALCELLHNARSAPGCRGGRGPTH